MSLSKWIAAAVMVVGSTAASIPASTGLLQDASAARAKMSVEQEAGLDPAFVNNLGSRSAMIAKFHRSDLTVDQAKQVVGSKLPATISTMLDHSTTAVKAAKTTKPLYDDSALKKARSTLNHMLHENNAQLDLTLVDCKASKEKYHGELDNLQADLEFLSASLAEARGQIAECHSRIEYADGLLFKLTGELNVHTTQCEKTRKKNEFVLNILINDLGVAKVLVKMTECAKKAASLMECAIPDGDDQDDDEDPKRLFTFADGKLRKQAALLQSDVAQKALQRALVESHPPHKLSKPFAHYSALMQSDLPADKLQKIADSDSWEDDDDDSDDDQTDADDDMDSDDDDDTKKTSTMAAISIKFPNNKRKPQVVSDKPNAAGAKLKCSVSGSPRCAILNDHMSTLAGEIASEKDELQHQMATDKTRCDRIQGEYEDEIGKWQTELNNQNILLAETTQKLNEWQFDQTEKSLLQRETFKAYTKKMYECHLKIKECVELDCGIKKIREKLGELGGAEPVLIEDCKVTDWTPTECSRSCNKGVMVLGREVTSPPTQLPDGTVLGEACPPLSMKTRCGEQPCPQNCRMKFWSGWSKCSKPCGGGLQQRTRSIKKPSQYGGEPCGETQQSRICNADSCDIDCKLRRWSKWSPCSKACNGGYQHIYRRMSEPAKGNGKCPRASSKRRHRMRRCNKHACPRKGTCASKVDIVLLVDGSGSVRRRGFRNEKKFARKLIKRVAFNRKTGAIMSVILFGWRVRLIQDFTDNTKVLTKKVRSMRWPRSSTNTAGAFNMANSVLLRARKGAQTVVMMVTDGRPNNEFTAGIAAKKLKASGARVIIVAVGPYIPTRVIKVWASDPPRENVYRVHNFRLLKRQITRFVTAMCPIVVR